MATSNSNVGFFGFTWAINNTTHYCNFNMF